MPIVMELGYRRSAAFFAKREKGHQPMGMRANRLKNFHQSPKEGRTPGCAPKNKTGRVSPGGGVESCSGSPAMQKNRETTKTKSKSTYEHRD